VRGSCLCGDTRIGCAGTRDSTCCPPREDGGVEYCADFIRDSVDCGACGVTCDPLAADRCNDGMCRCGAMRSTCAGTAEDRCCNDGLDLIECVDTTADRRHCGECGRACRVGQTCVAGVCEDPPPFDGGT
jgi:hypothetical protein